MRSNYRHFVHLMGERDIVKEGGIREERCTGNSFINAKTPHWEPLRSVDRDRGTRDLFSTLRIAALMILRSCLSS